MAELILNDAITVQTSAAIRRGLKRAGQVVLAASDAGAPREPEPRHGVHLTETGFTRVELGRGTDTAAIGYRAFWAIWQHENLTYNHPHGGHAKFLSEAMLEVGGAAIEAEIAPELRQTFG